MHPSPQVTNVLVCYENKHLVVFTSVYFQMPDHACLGDYIHFEVFFHHFFFHFFFHLPICLPVAFSEKDFTLKGKNLLPLGTNSFLSGSKFFHFRVNPISGKKENESYIP